MKTSSTLNTLLAAAVTATLAVAAPSAKADSQSNKSFFSKFKGDSTSEAAKKDSDRQNDKRSVSNATTHQKSKTMAGTKDSNKSFGSSLKFWDRDKDNTNANRDPSHRSVMKKNHKAESKDQPSIWDRMMFWRHTDHS